MAKARKDTGTVTQQSGTNQDVQQLIAQKAYGLWEQCGCMEGRDLEHWLEAERLIQQTRSSIQQPTSVQCSKCERSIPKTAAITIQGKVYCCPDCAQGKTCDCQ